MREIEDCDKLVDDDSKWIAGIFYYNPEDKRTFPPKRIKSLGWTVNFANTRSVMALVGIIVVFIVLVSIIVMVAR